MNADLEALIRLQEIRDRITTLTHRIETEIPAHIAELETELRQVKDRVEAGQADIQAAQRERARLELDLKTADEKIVKYKAALMQVKTNDEYRAALNEIDYTNRTRGDLENRVLELMELVETRREELKELEAELRTEDEKIQADRKVLEDERGELVAQRAAQEKAAAAIEAKLPENMAAAYRRISSVRGGVALARAEDAVCQACNMRMRPAIFQQVKRNEQVILCDSCGRILFHVEPPAPEEAPLSGETPAAATTHASPASRQGE